MLTAGEERALLEVLARGVGGTTPLGGDPDHCEAPSGITTAGGPGGLATRACRRLFVLSSSPPSRPELWTAGPWLAGGP